MWIVENNRLKCVTDESRIYFRTSISDNILRQLKEIAENNDTYVNYLFENGLTNLLKEKEIIYNKKQRPKDRIMYKTTYNKELIERVRKLAKENKLCANDVIEHSVRYIDTKFIKNKNYRSRIDF